MDDDKIYNGYSFKFFFGVGENFLVRWDYVCVKLKKEVCLNIIYFVVEC